MADGLEEEPSRQAGTGVEGEKRAVGENLADCRGACFEADTQPLPHGKLQLLPRQGPANLDHLDDRGE